MSTWRRNPSTTPCMFKAPELIQFIPSYRGGRLPLEAALTDLVCRAAPRLIANLGEYQEASRTGLRITRSRPHQVRDRGTGDYCDARSEEHTSELQSRPHL